MRTCPLSYKKLTAHIFQPTLTKDTHAAPYSCRMGAQGKLYFVSVEVIAGKKGIDLPRFLQKVNGVLEDYAAATRVIYKFKVTGQSKVLAVIEVSNILGFERTIGRLWYLGNVSISSVPVIGYESFGQNLGVNISLITNPQRPLPKENLYYWSFDVGYSDTLLCKKIFAGKSMEEFLSTWKKEAEFVFAARSKEGFPVELFKVVSERKVLCFLQVDDPVQLDLMSFQLPLMKENGDNVQVECRALQYLPEYCTRIFNEPL